VSRSRTVRTDVGAFSVRGSIEGAALDELARVVGAAARNQRVLAERVELGGVNVWIKGDHLPGKARVRHSLYARLGRPTPREREFDRLRWMRARLFRTPEPLFTGALRSAGLLRYQFLAMAPLAAHEPLAEALRSGNESIRNEWIRELAREVARLHTLHFVHRNLFFRNVLVDRTPTPVVGEHRRLILIDPWRGGTPLPRRGVDYDLGALMLDAAQAWSFDEQLAFCREYFGERAAQEKPASPSTLLERAARRRSELARRAPATARVEWDWRALAAAMRTDSRGPDRRP